MTKRLSGSFSCPAELALEILRGKWKSVILANLKERPMRFGELRSRIPRLSDKVLVQRLAELEELDLIRREKAGGRGAPSRYHLTRRAQALRPAFQALYDWGTQMAKEFDVVIGPQERGR